MSSYFSTYFQQCDTQYNANGALESYAKHSKDSGFTWLFHQIGQFFKSIVGLSDYQKAYRALYGSLKSGGVVDPNARQVAVHILDLAAKGSCPTNDIITRVNAQIRSATKAEAVVMKMLLPERPFPLNWDFHNKKIEEDFEPVYRQLDALDAESVNNPELKNQLQFLKSGMREYMKDAFYVHIGNFRKFDSLTGSDKEIVDKLRDVYKALTGETNWV